VLRFFANAAGVHDDEIREGDFVRRDVAVIAQHLLHALGVVHVHLTTERLDEISLHGNSRWPEM